MVKVLDRLVRLEGRGQRGSRRETRAVLLNRPFVRVPQSGSGISWEIAVSMGCGRSPAHQIQGFGGGEGEVAQRSASTVTLLGPGLRLKHSQHRVALWPCSPDRQQAFLQSEWLCGDLVRCLIRRRQSRGTTSCAAG